jgi:hypothetical protein
MRFKIGDRVVDDSSVYANLHGTIKGMVERFHPRGYIVKCEGDTLRWYEEDALEIDKEWHREERLKELGL